MRTNGNLAVPGTTTRLGDRVRDRVTGFEGIAASHAHHLTGCDRIGIQGQAQKDGKVPWLWADIAAVETLEVNAVNAEPIDSPTADAG